DPIADTVRGILDGHIVLSRKIASENHYPAIDIQQSLSRLMKEIVEEPHYEHAGRIKENLALYAESKDLIDVGAYRSGSNPLIDQAIRLNLPMKSFLKQRVEEEWKLEDTVGAMAALFNDQPRK